MDWLTFFSTLISDLTDLAAALAWPGLVCFGIYWFIKHPVSLAQMATYIEKFRLKDLEVYLREQHFDRAREAAEDVKEEIPEGAEPVLPDTPAPLDIPTPPDMPPTLPNDAQPAASVKNLRNLADYAGNMRILQMWVGIEKELRNFYGIKDDVKNLSGMALMSGDLSDADKILLKELKDIRNQVAHTDRPINMREALEYVQMANLLTKKLRSTRSKTLSHQKKPAQF